MTSLALAIPARIDLFGEPKALWFINRASGLVLLVLLTIVLVFGVLAARKSAGGKLPRFVSNEVHRGLALTAVIFLIIHVISAVLDDFVSIDLINIVVPWGSGWKPVWIGFGAVAVDLLIAVIVTSLLRNRMPESTWRLIHLSVFAMWPIAWIHALGSGTDAKSPAYLALSIVCALAVLGAALLRWFKPEPVPVPQAETRGTRSAHDGSSW